MKKYKVTAMVPMEFSVDGNFDPKEAIKTVQDIFGACRDDRDYADIVFDSIEESLRSDNIKYQVEIVTQSQPKVNEDSDTRSTAFDIVEIFEDYLDENGIYIVCDDTDEERERKANESGAMLYGMEYWHLVEDIECRLSHNIQYLRTPAYNIFTTSCDILNLFNALLVSKKLGDVVPSGENRSRLREAISGYLCSAMKG